MPIELAGIVLHKIHRIETLEQVGYVRYRVPGLDGELAQELGRQSVRLRIEGIFYGEEAEIELAKLRKVYQQKKAVEFLADIIGNAYFAEVLIDQLAIRQKAQEPDQFSYSLVITEYVKPPEAVLLESPAVDLGILSEAQSFMDAVRLPGLLDLPEFKDPTKPLDNMLSGLRLALEPLDQEEQTINQLFGTS